VVARLKEHVSVAQAQNEMTAIAARLEQAYPATNTGKSAAVTPLLDFVVGDTRPTLMLLTGAVALVLLIACANVANLLLARATGRTSELAVRAALGATRRRLIAQLMIESLALAVAAGAVGLLLARWGIAAVVALAPAGLPRVAEIAIDGRVMLFTMAASMAASLLFGVLPALQASRLDLNGALRQGGRGGAIGGAGAWTRSVLVVAEVALAVALVAGASLLIRSVLALDRVSMGFNPEHVLVVETSVPARDIQAARRATAFYTDMLPRLAALPGVTSVAGVHGLASARRRFGHDSDGGYWLEGGLDPGVVGVRLPQALFTVITPDYFKTMQIALRAGRDFDARDRYDAPMVAIVNESLARQAFEGANPIGRRIACGLDNLSFMTIVGVVADVRAYDPSRAPQPELYMPYLQHPGPATSLAVIARTIGDPAAMAKSFGEAIRAANPEVPTRATTLADTLTGSTATPRFRTWLVAGFAAAALLLAIAGVYGVMAYAVSRRTAEIGVRVAMGADAADVLRLVMRQGLTLAAVGAAVGCVLALALAQSIRSMLFAVAPADPLVFVVVPLGMVATAAVATAVPALRAARIDPIRALRTE
jgi:predicted permease